MTKDTDIAYLAGLIDGEGTVSLQLRKKHLVALRVVVYNTNEDVIDWCQAAFDGTKHKVGRVREGHKQEWQWFTHSDYAAEILEMVMPYLIIKRAKAEVALRAWRNRSPTPRSQRRQTMPPEILELRERYQKEFDGVK